MSFEPVHARHFNEDQKRLHGKILEEWNHSVVVKHLFGYWREYIRWFEGDQYVIYSAKRSELFDVRPLIDREIKNVYNRITPMIRQTWGDLHYRHEFYAIPPTSEAEDVRAAKAASFIIESTNRRGFNLALSEAKLWVLLVGNAYWKEFWNGKLYGLVKSEKGRVREPGDVDYGFVNPFNFRPDTTALHRKGWRFAIEGNRLPTSSIDTEFKLSPGTIKAESLASFETIFQRADIIAPPEGQAVRLEYWEGPSEEHSKGRFAVATSEYLLYDGENPTPGALIPYRHFKGPLPILGTQWGDSMVRPAQTPQRQLNRSRSMIDEHFENFRPKGMIPRGSLAHGDLSAFKRLGGIDFVQFNPHAGNPYWHNPPALPDSVMAWTQFQETEFEIETSVRKPSYGQLPKYAQRGSALLFQGLKRQDETPLYPMIEALDEELVEAMKLRLQIAKKHYSMPRILRKIGRGRKLSVQAFRGADIKDETDIWVVSGVDIIQTRQKKSDVVMALIEKGAVDMNTALELLDIKGVEEFVEEQHIDERQAQRHIEAMKTTGQYVPADPDDNHEVSFSVFNDYRKSEEFETLEPKIQNFIRKRMAEHQKFLRPKEEQGAESQPAAPGAPGEALPPGAVSPPPGAAAGLPADIPPELLLAALEDMAAGGGM